MLRRIYFILALCLSLQLVAQTVVNIENPSEWRSEQLSKYVGQTIQFDLPFYVCDNNNSSALTIAPKRIYQPTNQALPLSDSYNSILSINQQSKITLTNVTGAHRMGEQLHKLTVKVNSSSSVSLVSCEWNGNTRADIEQGIDIDLINTKAEHTILVCCMNLEYYLVDNFGTGYGPDTYAEHQKQRTKISKALAWINADLYGFVEIQQGQGALAEIASDLSKNTGRNFTYINDGGSTYGSYTKAGFVYCSDVLQPYGKLSENNTGVQKRKKTQAFKEIETGESFLFSVNHFKAKSGNGDGDNADKNDGQGSYNGDRKREAQSLLTYYNRDRVHFEDNDILIMGDLNAYAMEDPITILRDGGMTDLHRTFHADSSYSYVYKGQAGYLDHALCNNTLLPQVTGMTVLHINADENKKNAYYQSNDQTMFRCSDHDPVIVGLRLDSLVTPVENVITTPSYIFYENNQPYIRQAKGCYYTVYQLDGSIITQSKIDSNHEPILPLSRGIYIIYIRNKQGYCIQTKILVP